MAPLLREKATQAIESIACVLKAQNKAAELKAKLPRNKPKGAGKGQPEPPP